MDDCEIFLFLANGFRETVALEEGAFRIAFLVEVPVRLEVGFGGDVKLTCLVLAGRRVVDCRLRAAG